MDASNHDSASYLLATQAESIEFSDLYSIIFEEFVKVMTIDYGMLFAPESFARDIRKKDLLVDIVGKERIGSDISECSADKVEQHNIDSEPIPSLETSLAIGKHGKRKKLARLDFLEAKGVVYLSSDYLSFMSLIIAEKYIGVPAGGDF